MPKLIDHEQREQEIAEAAWRVLARDGLIAMSVRNVSAEAGIAAASLRRAFPTQAALRASCLDQCVERVAARIVALDQTQPARDYLEACIWELLPFDAQRHLELDAQLALGTLVGTDPLITASYERSHQRAADWFERLIRHLAATDPQYAHLAPDAAAIAREVHALVDGLALQLWHDPAVGAPEARAGVQRIVRQHLDRLALGRAAPAS